jgi:Xaa-Pro aminopeptidase
METGEPIVPKLKQRVRLDVAHYRKRLAGIQRYLDGKGLDGILLLNPANVSWATGFFFIPNERPLGLYVPAAGTPAMFVPFLEKENAEANWIDDVRWYWEYPGKIPPELWMMKQIQEERLALDQAGYATVRRLQAVRPGLALDDGVFRMRYLKTEAEIDLIRLAAGYADFGLGVARQAMVGGLAAGITELDVVHAVQAETTAKMRREMDDLVNSFHGAVVLTVHTGPRAALPHGQPGLVDISPGDTVIVGIGVTVGGYHAESGCTFVVGAPNGDQRRCLEATWACDEAAVRALRPGMRCSDVNEAALAVLSEAGYGDYIRHRIGHGIGLDGHEAPWLSEGDETLLKPSMVFSNEPGIYRPGTDGYRIIDTMLVTPEGGQRLSRYLSEHGPDDRVVPV